MTWFLKITEAGVEEYLTSLGATGDIIAWITSQPDAQFFVNEIRKNPTMQVQDLQMLAVPEQKSPYTERELTRAKNYAEPFKAWMLIQLKKMRIKRLDIPASVSAYGDHAALEDYQYVRNIMGIERDFDLIYDWWRFVEPPGMDRDVHVRPDIASYTFEAAMQAQADWHAEQKKAGSSLRYDPPVPGNIMFKPDTWKGWSIQRIVSKNDLEVEGNEHKMDHCVAGYWKHVRDGTTEIFSLRDEANEPHVTIEIEPDGSVKQIMGVSDTKPDDQYKQMIREWFETYQESRPELYMEGEEPYEFDFRYTDNDKIDEVINAAVDGPGEYGLKAPLSLLDVEKAYSAALHELEGGRYGQQSDTRNVDYIGKAIAYAAWEADKYRASKIDWSDKKAVQKFHYISGNEGVKWLEQKEQENAEELYGHWEPYEYDGIEYLDYDEFALKHADDYEPGADEEIAAAYENYQKRQEEERERIDGKAMDEHISNNLPYALDREIGNELTVLGKTDNFLNQYKAQLRETFLSKELSPVQPQVPVQPQMASVHSLLRKISHMKISELGDCFRANARWAMQNDAQVVHGEVTNIEGKRFHHCWAETDGKVHDETTGLDGMTDSRYYELLQIEDVDRYEWPDAAARMVREKHWGPWG